MNIRTTIKCDCGRRIVNKQSVSIHNELFAECISADIYCPGCGARITTQTMMQPTSETVKRKTTPFFGI